MKSPRITQSVLLLAALSSGAATLFFGFLYFSLYWPYRNLFDGEGRYFDARHMVVYHEQNGLLIAPTLFFLLLASWSGIAWRVRRRARSTLVSGR